MSTFSDMITTVLATVPTGANAATPQDGDFGSDLSCMDDSTALFDELSADNPDVVKEAFYRWLLTTPGTLPDPNNKDWGGGLWQMLRVGMTATEIASIPSRLQTKWYHDDDRTSKLVISPLTKIGRDQYSFDVRAETDNGPFSLVLSASGATQILKEMSGP